MQAERRYEFWTDKIAREIAERKKFRFTEDQIPEFKKFVVKTSASLSGVLHIGRLSDTIRGEAVFRSLQDAGLKSELIWVAEDMDPLRKVPDGVPKNYADYIGMPVTDIPDPDGCHGSYGEHHMSEYFKVVDKFVSSKMKKFSMREEYRKGSFRDLIKKLIDSVSTIIEIQNRYRINKLASDWSPWTPICDNCGKIITPKIEAFRDGKVFYRCQDYVFEKFTAKGCGYEGVNDPLKGNGKLMWKSEWAAQWPRWGVVSEGAGKEYEAKGSAFWINAEICERILGFPSPVPIFYEHLTIDGEKMSASVGNVIYPKDWLASSTPEILRMLFLKDPMRARDFRWDMIPNMYDERDILSKVYHSQKKVDSERDELNMRRLFEQMQTGEVGRYINMPAFSTIVELLKVGDDKFVEKKLAEYGFRLDGIDREPILERIAKAKSWLSSHCKPVRESVDVLNERSSMVIGEGERKVLYDLMKEISDANDGEGLQAKIFEIAKRNEMKPAEMFRLVYRILIKADRGPRLGPYIMEVGKEEILRRLRAVL